MKDTNPLQSWVMISCQIGLPEAGGANPLAEIVPVIFASSNGADVGSVGADVGRKVEHIR
jgi:hypothetical protein